MAQGCVFDGQVAAEGEQGAVVDRKDRLLESLRVSNLPRPLPAQ
jgi:hypothetical protein